MQRFRGHGAVSIAGMTLLVACLLGSKPLQAQTLYDGEAGGLPADQGWFLLGTFPGGASETYDAVNKHTTLNTSANEGIFSGYSSHNVALTGPPSFITPTTPVNAGFPILDRTQGFTVNFTMQLVAETHSSLARAGFSVLVITDDQLGVEIGFHSTDIFAQSSNFNVEEINSATSIATLTAAMTSYSLTIQGNSFFLSGNNTPILAGLLKDYTDATGFGTDVYRTPSFLFLGDDTTSASATTNLKFVSIAAVAPEPSTVLLVLTGLLGFAGKLAARRRTI